MIFLMTFFTSQRINTMTSQTQDNIVSVIYDKAVEYFKYCMTTGLEADGEDPFSDVKQSQLIQENKQEILDLTEALLEEYEEKGEKLTNPDDDLITDHFMQLFSEIIETSKDDNATLSHSNSNYSSEPVPY